jgi:hypothetical protein
VAFSAQAPVGSPVPADSEIRKILADRIGSETLGTGIVFGVINAKGRRVCRLRRPRQGRQTAAQWRHHLRDRLHDEAVTDPISKYLPASRKSTRAKQPEDHFRGSFDTELRPRVPSQGSVESLRRLLDRTALSVSFRLPAHDIGAQ